jgi:hypothetical protein
MVAIVTYCLCACSGATIATKIFLPDLVDNEATAWALSIFLATGFYVIKNSDRNPDKPKGLEL